MSDSEIGYLSAAELLAQYRARRLSPVEVVEAVLRHVEASEPAINAMARLTPEHARTAARESEARWMRGEARLLDGVPVTIKDLQHTKGVQTDFGTKLMQGTIPDVDAPCVTRLHEAGCAMLGKSTAAAEWGWKGVSHSPVYGITHNPWKRGYNAGASSSGAGAGAAAGYGPLHQGGDGAGSIRMPAHFSGVYGLKPTHGRIANWPMSNNDLATHIGPLTRTVRDAALMLQAMAGPHPWDYTALEAPPQDYAARLGDLDLRGRRIAYSADLGHARVDPEVAALVEEAVRALEAMGAVVEAVTPAWGPQGPELARYFWPATFSSRLKYLPGREAEMDPGFVAMIRSMEGRGVAEFMAMRERRYAYCQAIHDFMQGYDFLLTPAVSVAAFPADRLQPEHWPQHPWDWLSWAEFSYPFNWSGNPAASLPCGFTAEGLPVGLQIVGRRFDDLGVLQASAAFEAARPWAQHRPPLAA
ncbi:amidase family protein [Pseudoroseomonas cervicalis]|uniref:amidase family protein n=1 Tax=Teichococcus cervicalis TaxID=204525 RepID=UPI0027859427|nr:amidase family protein [Pseudoroseomonas cervicalis]MDQ1081837.1 aspartyl-tRNA(Asn)/glutamyl-tRNA(Gln) amidotransferase subunit A [Pseudoroseomonas cervicalis]